MDDRPLTRFATASDGISLAYRVVGDGACDVVVVPNTTFMIDLLWEEPGFIRFAERLAAFSRVIFYDGRGLGASGGDFMDRGVDEIVDADLVAVCAAAGCDQVVLLANGVAADAVRFAATHPERVRALVLINSTAHYVREDDYPWGLPQELLERYAAAARDTWGTGAAVDILCPSKAGDDRFRDWWARCERLGVGVDKGASMLRLAFERDVRALLPTLTVPTLIVHRSEDRYIRVGAGRYLAEHIPDATYVELPGVDDPYFVGDIDALVDEIEEFLTGRRQAPEGDVVLAAVLFTDIVASTQQLAQVGHRKWHALIDDHEAMVRAALHRHRGHMVKALGDGYLATFDASTRAVRAADQIVTSAAQSGLAVRAGVHVGEVAFRSDDISGLAVTIAKRICDLSQPAEVLISETTNSLTIGSDIATSDRGTHTLKGVPGQWHLFAVDPFVSRA